MRIIICSRKVILEFAEREAKVVDDRWAAEEAALTVSRIVQKLK